SISQPQEEAAPCFLDKGYAFSMLQARQPRWNIGRIFGQGDDEVDFETRALGLNEVAAKVLLGEIPADQAAVFAKERCVVPAEMRRHDTDPAANNPDVPYGVPAWLKGRFGPDE